MTGKSHSRGYALITAILAVTLLAVFMLMARARWQTLIQRDLEAELLFRGRQYVHAMESYAREHLNQSPPALRVLEEEKHIRRLYPDPMSPTGQWNLVLKPNSGGTKLLIVPPNAAGPYLVSARLVGVCSSSSEPSFLEYRGRKRYNEWAFYLGEKPDEDMPPLEYVGGS